MDALRLQRYADKLAHAEQRLEWVEEWRGDALKDPRSRLAAYKAFQEAIEAFMDVAAMATVDAKRGVKDDATNLGLLASVGAISPALVPPLREANNLRNVLVHEYDGIDDALALTSASRLAPALSRAIQEVRVWLSKQS